MHLEAWSIEDNSPAEPPPPPPPIPNTHSTGAHRLDTRLISRSASSQRRRWVCAPCRAGRRRGREAQPRRAGRAGRGGSNPKQRQATTTPPPAAEQAAAPPRRGPGGHRAPPLSTLSLHLRLVAPHTPCGLQSTHPLLLAAKPLSQGPLTFTLRCASGAQIATCSSLNSAGLRRIGPRFSRNGATG